MERFSRRQFITGGAVAALGGTLALAGCAPSGSSNAKGSNGAGSGSSAGIGSGMGKHGQFDVEVMVTDGNLDRITVLNSRETPGMGDVAIYTELGRYMMGPYGCLVTKAIHEKHTHKEYIGVDACAVNLMRPAMYGAYHHITVMGKEDQPCDHLYDVTGSLCENNDKFAIDRYLPQVDKGDLLVIHDTGAHGFAMGYNYNGKLKSAEILLHEDGSFEMIRRAETAKDYFATFDCFPIYEKLLEDADRLK